MDPTSSLVLVHVGPGPETILPAAKDSQHPGRVDLYTFAAEVEVEEVGLEAGPRFEAIPLPHESVRRTLT